MKIDESNDANKLPPTQLPSDRSELILDDEALISAVVSHLGVPPHYVQAIEEHSNSIHEQHSKDGVQAFAKLAGRDWTFYVKMLRSRIGRPPEGSNLLSTDSQLNNSTSVLQDVADDENRVHIDLGPNKMISRQHAEIYFDPDTECWNISVNGRNGVRVDNKMVRKGDHHALISGQVIEIGGIEMMFVLPGLNGSLTVDKRYLQKAGLIQKDEAEGPHSGPIGPALVDVSPTLSGSRGQNPLPIAPAPPDYRRPGTPVTSRTKTPYSTGKSPGYSNGGTMLMNADDVDLSLDSNKHMKPSYSYAQMISQAILDTEDEKLNLNGIYTYIQDKYAYYRHQLGGGWQVSQAVADYCILLRSDQKQNSIRHNLSLNKSFHKVARSTDEPGKGMKWCIHPDARDEMAKNCVRGGRGGHRGSSAPGSPGGLGYMARPSKDLGTNPSSAQRMKRSPRSFSPPSSSFPANAPQFTPDRGQLSSLQDQLPGDGSPLPRHRRPNNTAFGLSDNVPGSPPVLSSSYQQEDGTSFVTPAPHRVHPRLAPPSTAQRPSQHMPTSSPAPFWKYADIGSTPMKGTAFDMSPIKGSKPGCNPPSSSPPPVRRTSATSPSRNGVATRLEMPDADELEDEDAGFDLTRYSIMSIRGFLTDYLSRGFQSIGSYHAPAANLALPGALQTR